MKESPMIVPVALSDYHAKSPSVSSAHKDLLVCHFKVKDAGV